MLDRTLEPEVMNTVDEAIDYDQMDHSTVNRIFVDDLLQSLPRDLCQPRRVFDAGTGTAQIPIELVRRGVPWSIVASDLAGEMLTVARRNVDRAGFSERVELVQSDCKQLPDADATYDVVMSNSIVHHIPVPGRVLAELWRIARPGGCLFVRDLLRPATRDDVERLVQTYAGSANAHQQQMFRDSLHAALTVTEVRELLAGLGIPGESVQATSDRHWTIHAIRSP